MRRVKNKTLKIMNESIEINAYAAGSTNPIDGTPKSFKTCSMCGFEWPTLASFIEDASLRVEGYQACFEYVEDGLIMVTHTCPKCFSTIAVPVRFFNEFRPKGPELPLLKDSDACEGRCVNENDLKPCAADCKMRWVRDLLQILRKHHIE